jgi:CheY-like chemotaxis protein
MSRPIILHIEDDSSDVLLLRQAFCQAGLPVALHSQPDGEQALAYLRGNGQFADRLRFPLPDLVLLDLKLLGLSGFDVLEWIRREEEFRRLPVVVLSSSNQEAEIKRSYQLGANSYLLKPVGFEALVALLAAFYHYWFELNELPKG